MKQQHGFLILTAVAIIIIFGLLGGFLVYVLAGVNAQSTYLNEAKQAMSLAESGFEQAKSGLTQPTLVNRNTCAYAPTTTLSTGTFSLNNTGYDVSTTLATGFTNADSPTTLTVASTAALAPFGRILIGQEIFSYTGIGDATTLTGVTRAQAGTEVSTYDNGTVVSQYQCTINGTGHAPNASTPNGSRVYQVDIEQPMVFGAANSGAMFNWNPASSELTWSNMMVAPDISSLNINAVTALNYHDGWFAASLSGGVFQLGRLQGGDWASFTFNPGAGIANHLYGIYATSTLEAWAVGDPVLAGNQLNILRWINDGSNTSTNWCVIPTIPGAGCTAVTRNETGLADAEKILLAVKAVNTNGSGFADEGYAVGGEPGTAASTSNRGIVMQYDGSTWSSLALTANSSIGQLFGVDITPPQGGNHEAFFVGQSSNSGSAQPGIIIRLRNGVLSIDATPTQKLNAISVIDSDADGLANFGCAVGDAGLVITLDANLTLSSTTLPGNPTLTGVTVLSATDIWVIGHAVGTTPTAFHYDGSSWTNVASGIPNSTQLNGVAAIFSKTPVGTWQDLVN